MADVTRLVLAFVGGGVIVTIWAALSWRAAKALEPDDPLMPLPVTAMVSAMFFTVCGLVMYAVWSALGVFAS